MTGFEWSGMSPMDAAAAFGQLPSALESQLGGAAADIAQRIRGDAAENAPVDTGDLQSRIEGLVESVSQTIVRIRVGTNRDGAAAQEFGLDAGEAFPPASSLRGWARRVLGDEDAAFPVARSIYESGIEGQSYLSDAFEDNLEWALDRINRAVDDAFGAVGLA